MAKNQSSPRGRPRPALRSEALRLSSRRARFCERGPGSGLLHPSLLLRVGSRTEVLVERLGDPLLRNAPGSHLLQIRCPRIAAIETSCLVSLGPLHGLFVPRSLSFRRLPALRRRLGFTRPLPQRAGAALHPVVTMTHERLQRVLLPTSHGGHRRAQGGPGKVRSSGATRRGRWAAGSVVDFPGHPATDVEHDAPGSQRARRAL